MSCCCKKQLFVIVLWGQEIRRGVRQHSLCVDGVIDFVWRTAKLGGERITESS